MAMLNNQRVSVQCGAPPKKACFFQFYAASTPSTSYKMLYVSETMVIGVVMFINLAI